MGEWAGIAHSPIFLSLRRIAQASGAVFPGCLGNPEAISKPGLAAWRLLRESAGGQGKSPWPPALSLAMTEFR